MTIASEITRLQWAKADIKTSIEGKGVTVPSSASIDEYSWYIDQITTTSIDSIFVPATLTIVDWMFTNYAPSITEQLWDATTADNSAYYKYFWLRDTDTTAYSKFRMCVWKKLPWSDPTTVMTDRIVDDRTYFRRMWWRMKRSWNDVMFSALYLHWTTTNPSTAKDEYFCVNAVNDTFSSPVNLWILEDVWEATIYANWTTSCGITAEESMSAMGLSSLSIVVPTTANWYNLDATLTIN